MKTIFIALLSAYSFVVASAQDADKVKALEERVQKLEERMKRIEFRYAAGPVTPEVKKMMLVARRHVGLEQKNFKLVDIETAERLYQRSSQTTSESESRMLLDSIVSTYPQLNRARCAQLYLAQRQTGKKRSGS